MVVEDLDVVVGSAVIEVVEAGGDLMTLMGLGELSLRPTCELPASAPQPSRTASPTRENDRPGADPADHRLAWVTVGRPYWVAIGFHAATNAVLASVAP